MAYTDIDDPSVYFQTKLYTGTQNSHAITLDGNSDLSPNWVWIKCRDDSHNHQVFDSVRGVHKRMRTDTTGAETTSNESLKSFDSDGFTLGTQQNVNASSSGDNSFVAWNWKEDPAAGFDIVSYTGNATGGRTVAHSLSAVPAMMIVKNRDAAIKWAVYHKDNTSAPETDHLQLNSTDASSDDDSTWNDTAPTSSVFSLGGSTSTNGDGTKYIAYLFADVKGYSKFGTYKGNGNVNGTFIYLGFKPAWILIRKLASQSWTIQDNKRNPINNDGNMTALKADDSGTEENEASHRIDYLSNGFKMRYTWEGNNNNGTNYIYMAFAENPFVTSSDGGSIPACAR